MRMTDKRPEAFDEQLRRMAESSGVSPAALGEVLERVLISAPQPVARVDIARGEIRSRRLSPLSPGTVSKATKILVDEGLLGEEPRHVGVPGRPTVPLRLGRTTMPKVPRRGLIGVHVGLESEQSINLYAVLTTLDGKLLHPDVDPETTKAGDPLDPMDVLSAIQTMVEALIGATRNDKSLGLDEVLGVGIDIAGHVHQGQIVETTQGRADWHNVDIAEELSRRLNGLHVVVDNDVNVLAVYETYNPRFSQRDMALVAVFDEGVGAALILNGRVYRGARGMAGEPGHCRVPDEHRSRPQASREDHLVRFSDPCHCGGENPHVDCFAPPRRLRGELGIREENKHEFQALADTEAYTSSGERTPTAEVFHRGGRALGIGIANIINIINPGRVIVKLPPTLRNAKKGRAAAAYREAMEKAIDEESFSTGAQDARAHEPRLVIDELNPETTRRDSAHAAAIRVLDNFIEHAREFDPRSRERAGHQRASA